MNQSNGRIYNWALFGVYCVFPLLPGFLFAGLLTTNCLCYNISGIFEPMLDTYCNTACPGNSNETCGSADTTELYRVGKFTHSHIQISAPSCDKSISTIGMNSILENLVIYTLKIHDLIPVDFALFPVRAEWFGCINNVNTISPALCRDIRNELS